MIEHSTLMLLKQELLSARTFWRHLLIRANGGEGISSFVLPTKAKGLCPHCEWVWLPTQILVQVVVESSCKQIPLTRAQDLHYPTEYLPV